MNELVKAALPNAEILDKSRLFFIRKLGKFLFNLCAYGQRSRTFFCGFVIKLLHGRRFIADFIFGYIRGIDNGLCGQEEKFVRRSAFIVRKFHAPHRLAGIQMRLNAFKKFNFVKVLFISAF